MKTADFKYIALEKLSEGLYFMRRFAFLLLLLLVACGGGGGGGGPQPPPPVEPPPVEPPPVEPPPVTNTDDLDRDGDGIGNNADLCDSVDSVANWTSSSTTDADGDGCRDLDEDDFLNNPEAARDIDPDNDGLIEITTPEELSHVRYDYNGKAFRVFANRTGTSIGCYGNMSGDVACNGYELAGNIDLSEYSNWQPIGYCLTRGSCPDGLNSTFEGNNRTISNLNISVQGSTSPLGVGLFGAINNASVIQNTHVRNAMVKGGIGRAGILVGHAEPMAQIINSSVQGEIIIPEGIAVGGLVGYGKGIRISRSQASNVFIKGQLVIGALIGYGREANILLSQVDNIVANGDRFVAGLVGEATAATIFASSANNVTVYSYSNNVSHGYYVGGLIGNAHGARVYASYVLNANVTGREHVGGLAGWAVGTNILSSYSALGSVDGNVSVGGLVGNSLASNIKSSYTVLENVEGVAEVGGLVGRTWPHYGSVEDSFWDITLSEITDRLEIPDNKEGIPLDYQQLQSETNFSGVYDAWDDNLWCNRATGEFTTDSDSLLANDANNAWDLGSNVSYPIISCAAAEDDPTTNLQRNALANLQVNDADMDGVADIFDAFPNNASESSDRDGDGIGDNADSDDDNDGRKDGNDNCQYVANQGQENGDTDELGDACDIDDNNNGLIDIRTAAELNQIRNNLNGNSLITINSTGTQVSDRGCGIGDIATECNGYELLADIDLSGYDNWQPIGYCLSKSSCPVAFNSIFEGNNHIISNLNINVQGSTNPVGVGLFGAISKDAVIQNTQIRNAMVKDGIERIGILVGYAERMAQIINSSAQGEIISPEAGGVGGLVGFGEGIHISRSQTSNISIRGRHGIGGLIGHGREANISLPQTDNTVVNGVDHVGGLVGNGEGAHISRSQTSNISIRGRHGVGGLIGHGRSASISLSHTDNIVVNGVDSVGGLVANGGEVMIFVSSANNVIVNSSGNYVGGLVGWAQGARVYASYALNTNVTGVDHVGGLAGVAQGARIISSYAAGGEVSGRYFVGGLVGISQKSNIKSSYAAMERVEGSVDVGGLVGRAAGDSTDASYWDVGLSGVADRLEVSDIREGIGLNYQQLRNETTFSGIYDTWDDNFWCNRATGEFTIDSSSSLANSTNIAWDLGDTTSYPIISCAAAEDSLTTNLQRNVLANLQVDDADMDGVADIFDKFPNNASESSDRDGDGTGDNTDMNNDNDTFMDMADNCPYATNQGQEDNDTDGVGNACDIDKNNNGLIDITTADQLNQIRNNFNGNSLITINSTGTQVSDRGCGIENVTTECNGYELLADIDLSGYDNWQPIGYCPNAGICFVTFNGTFEGNNHIISNLNISVQGSTSSVGVGLFGAISKSAVIQNTHIRNATVKGGSDRIGILVGSAEKMAQIISSSAQGEIISYGANNVGGLVGHGYGIHISRSYVSNIFIKGRLSIASLIGYGFGANISLSHADNSVINGESFVGGLVGNGGHTTIFASSVNNVTVKSSGTYIGGLAGLAHGASIYASYVLNANVTGWEHVGGLAGWGSYARIISSYAALGEVRGHSSVGGLVGMTQASNIKSSYAAMERVEGYANVGGLVGIAWADSIKDSFWDITLNGVADRLGIPDDKEGTPLNYRQLQSETDFSGIYATWDDYLWCNRETGEFTTDSSSPLANSTYNVWYLGSATSYPIIKCDSTGDGLATNEQTNVLAQDTDKDGILDLFDKFPNNASESSDRDGDGTGDNADTNNDDDMLEDSADNCPYVANEGQEDKDGDKVGDACDIDKNNNGLIDITTAAELSMIRNNPNGTSLINITPFATQVNDRGCTIGSIATECNGYELLADIDLIDYGHWQPIGNCLNLFSCSAASRQPFNSTFEGNNRMISNLTVNRGYSTGDWQLGFFGSVSNNAVIRNVHIRNAKVSGHSATGILVGVALNDGLGSGVQGAQIINSSVQGIINAPGSYVGGLVGRMRGGKISSSKVYNTRIYTSPRIGGSRYVGGMVGRQHNAIIYSSNVNNTVIKAWSQVGGMVGYALGSKIHLSYSDNITVEGRVDAGGLVGSGESSIVYGSYANDVGVRSPVAGGVVGGLVGNAAALRIYASYANSRYLRSASRVGGLVGRMTAASKIISSYAAGREVYAHFSVGGLVASTYSVKDSEGNILKSSYSSVKFVQRANGAIGKLFGFPGNTVIIDSYSDSTLRNYVLPTFPAYWEAELGSTPTATLQNTTTFDVGGIYETWDDDLWCDVATGEFTTNSTSSIAMDTANNVWDLGNSTQYPALTCTPGGVARQRE